jgi:hypothetical protein
MIALWAGVMEAEGWRLAEARLRMLPALCLSRAKRSEAGPRRLKTSIVFGCSTIQTRTALTQSTKAVSGTFDNRPPGGNFFGLQAV